MAVFGGSTRTMRSPRGPEAGRIAGWVPSPRGMLRRAPGGPVGRAALNLRNASATRAPPLRSDRASHPE